MRCRPERVAAHGLRDADDRDADQHHAAGVAQLARHVVVIDQTANTQAASRTTSATIDRPVRISEPKTSRMIATLGTRTWE